MGIEACWRMRARVKPAGPAPIIAILGEGMVMIGIVLIKVRFWRVARNTMVQGNRQSD
jgi:hypothetical protein